MEMGMEIQGRRCLDCGADISERGRAAKRCKPCAYTRTLKLTRKRERKLWATDPEHRERKREQARARERTPEFRARDRDRYRQRYATDSAFRERILSRQRETYAKLKAERASTEP